MSINELPIVLPKPFFGAPCNGCGWCCTREVCGIGKTVFGQDQEAPCPALVDDGKRYYCALVITEENSPLRANPLIAISLGIGKGCCADDEERLTPCR